MRVCSSVLFSETILQFETNIMKSDLSYMGNYKQINRKTIYYSHRQRIIKRNFLLHSTITDLKKHEKEVHLKAAVKNFKCTKCTKTFLNQPKLFRHFNGVHENIRNHKCNQCEKAFHEVSDLKSHIMVVHQLIKNHKCGFCKKLFGLSGNLRRHIKTVHTVNSYKLGKYPCHICDMISDTKRNLNFHVTTMHVKKSQNTNQTDHLEKAKIK